MRGQGQIVRTRRRRGTPIAFRCPPVPLFRAELVIPTPHRGSENTVASIRLQQ
jgi:hypothetical protein